MDTLEPGIFVRYHPEGMRSDHHAAFVLGLLGPHGEKVLLCIIQERMPREATHAECTVVDAHTIRSGLVGFIGRHVTFGQGEVVDEEVIDNLLYLTLERDGLRSEPIPIPYVTLCCPCSSCA